MATSLLLTVMVSAALGSPVPRPSSRAIDCAGAAFGCKSGHWFLKWPGLRH
ncbi:hypothetical protein PF005_g33629 [Phytophthora fragariae]|uniref:RxLR effector protein n=1 Tax=Phytophthora fragariae TaxID=53985 RepID=A0A6A3U5Y9_9STRA|nr:hypothetical protein PF011_g33044 [Phytophthora fragariae]KAE9053644.1 hypothetical protein PF006_g33494 [Phytophthora fragariae]KAE9055262.1 hypothetical protein PF010_g32214 [Phytophthora fragariae]KAE9146960.1 hypothetical protein PF005_g33629 [Phytophthora fragariae]KAE9147600.1 hypothetical protein PF004_g32986 [Phytophthora fragariae]